ncbi:MAG: hypothetical protein MZV65_45035 [Chromatiales bacterium]|nr:hypothetical protein [Chromatiales bacterium]
MDEVTEILPLIDELHFDVMDGVFVENISMGLPVIDSLRNAIFRQSF